IAALAMTVPVLCQAALPAGPGDDGRTSAFTTSMAARSAAVPADRETMPGAPLYHAKCAICHEGQVPKAPIKTFLQF
ncbi:hypothetical protein ABTJ77_19955, partial [Acinetobacter baumannii]